MKLKKTYTGLLSPAGGGVGGGVLLRGGRSFLPPLICVALLLVFGFWGNSGASAAVDYPPLAGVQGVEYVPASADQGGIDAYTKLMLHADGSDQGTSFTDSSSGAKTVTNTETYDSHTKLMLHMENNVTDSTAGKTVTNNNVTSAGSGLQPEPMGLYGNNALCGR